jgi:hypothetical protein
MARSKDMGGPHHDASSITQASLVDVGKAAD